MITTLVLAQTSAAFSPILADATETTIDKWMDSNHSVLGAAP